MMGVVMLLRDVTRLKELDRLKSEFVMTASHELRTPLTSMGMSIDLLRENAVAKLNDKEQQLLSAAHEELERIKALVNDLLDLSKIEAGKIDMEFDRVAVQLLFEKAVSALLTQADDKKVELSISLPTALPEIKADANKITWVLTNLIANALRYTSSGGRIQLFAEHFGPQVHLSVSDDGAGIPYEYQSKIFEKFVQVEKDKTVHGSGLGLAICKEIVRAHGGTIWVDSLPGEGSTFTFTLPVFEQ
jgi:NtrC-family two-component system sensor histidine kinase KinB